MRTARRTTVAAAPPPEKISGVSMPSTPGGSGSRIGRIGLGFCGAVGFAAKGEGRIRGEAGGLDAMEGGLELEVSVSGSSELQPVSRRPACQRVWLSRVPGSVAPRSLSFLHYRM